MATLVLYPTSDIVTTWSKQGIVHPNSYEYIDVYASPWPDYLLSNGNNVDTFGVDVSSLPVGAVVTRIDILICYRKRNTGTKTFKYNIDIDGSVTNFPDHITTGVGVTYNDVNSSVTSGLGGLSNASIFKISIEDVLGTLVYGEVGLFQLTFTYFVPPRLGLCFDEQADGTFEGLDSSNVLVSNISASFNKTSVRRDTSISDSFLSPSTFVCLNKQSNGVVKVRYTAIKDSDRVRLESWAILCNKYMHTALFPHKCILYVDNRGHFVTFGSPLIREMKYFVIESCSVSRETNITQVDLLLREVE